MLRLENVTASWGGPRIIHEVSIEIEEGATVGMLGPNGAGKSTLMAAITGTLRHRGGKILLGDRDMAGLDSHRIVAAGMALVPEGRQIFAPMTVADNLALGATRLKRGGGRSLSERFRYVFNLFPRLEERRSQIAGTLSGGEQQMLAIGRALMGAPRMLLLDEPFLGLAPMIVQEIRAALDELRGEGLTIFLVEQKLDIALELASRAYVMIKGRIVLEATAKELRDRPDLGNLYFALADAAA